MNVCNYGTWNFDILFTHLSQDIKMEMASVFTNDDSYDIIIWEPSISSSYSTKPAYSWLTLELNPPHIRTMTWSWILNLKLPENICHFVWGSFLPTIHGSINTCQQMPLVIDVLQLKKPSYTLLEIALRSCKFGIISVSHLALIFMRMIYITG